MKKLYLLILFLVLSFPAWATTYYVRDGGGTSAQCTGLVNAVYPGSGSAQPCALAHPAWLHGVGGHTGSTTQIWTNGDTEDIVGDSDTTWDFTVSGITTAPAIGDTYTNNGYTWTVTVVNLNGANDASGSGTISASSAVNESPSGSGTLTRTSGSGDSTISFSATTGSQAEYMIGYGMPNVGSACNNTPNQCYLSPPPPGISSSQLTKIIGIGTHRPQLWGTQADLWVLNLTPNGNTLLPPASGTLTRVSGSGDSTISYSQTNTSQANITYGFNVSGVIVTPSIGSQYSNSGTTFSIAARNISGGQGTMVGVNSYYPPNNTGILSKVSGTGDSNINYTTHDNANNYFLVSGVTTAPQQGDEYSIGGVTYDVVSSTIVGGAGAIEASGELDEDIENLEITQHSSCACYGHNCDGTASSNPGYGPYPSSCAGSYPFGTFANWLIWTEGVNLTTKNLWVHNSPAGAFWFAGGLINWNSSNDKVGAAQGALDNGPSMYFGGNNSMTSDVWAFGGCSEKYPLPDPSNVKDTTNYLNCIDQNGGSLGGGFMMQTNASANACGNWNIINSQFLFNLKTNIDFLHCDGTGNFHFYRSRSEGSTGESLKIGENSMDVEESQMIGDAPVWNQTAFQAIKAPYSTSNTSWNYNICRGEANVNISSPQSTFINDDFEGNCTCDLCYYNRNTVPGAFSYVYNSKIITPYFNPGGGNGNAVSFYGGPPPPITEDYNSMYNNRDTGSGTIGCNSDQTHGAHDLCIDPLLTFETTYTYEEFMGPTSYYGGTDLGDQIYLQSTSPLRSAGSNSETYANPSGDIDYNFQAPTDSPQDIGAVQVPSCVIGNQYCSISSGQCCNSQTCQTDGMCPTASGVCSANGVSCSVGTNCCAGYCVGGLCSACLTNGTSSSIAVNCCSGLIIGGLCSSCLNNGTSTSSSADCCSGLSASGSCVSCLPSGTSASNPLNCCTGLISGGQCVNYICGDGLMPETGKTCDTNGPNLYLNSCVNQGYKAGILGCTPGCLSFDTSQCTNAYYGPTVVQSTSWSNNNGGVPTLILPTSPTVGNIMIAFISYGQYAGSRNCPTPSGWTLLDQSNITNSLSVFYRIVQSGDGTTYTFPITNAGGDQNSATMYEITGENAVTPFNGHSLSLHYTDHETVATTNSLTPTFNNTLAVTVMSSTYGTNLVSVTNGFTLDQSSPSLSNSNSFLSSAGITTGTSTAVSNSFTVVQGLGGDVEEIALVAPGNCTINGGTCSSGSTCCSGICSGSQCVACTANGQSCSTGATCCSNLCSGSQCVSCYSNGTSCSGNNQCCTNYCNGSSLCANAPVITGNKTISGNFKITGMCSIQ